jgi:transposase-like protein
VRAARHDRQFWERASREVDGGSRVADVARRLGVRAGTLSWWRWRLHREAPPPARRGGAEFLPVVIAEPARVLQASAVEVETSGGVRVRVELGTDVGYVASLVAAIRSRC